MLRTKAKALPAKKKAKKKKKQGQRYNKNNGLVHKKNACCYVVHLS